MYYYYFSLLLLLIYCLLILCYKYGWKKQQKIKTETVKQNYFLSIIIPARNEAENIKKVLQSILLNNFSQKRYEIIVIDDFSEDGTAEIATTFFRSNQFNNGQVLSLKRYISKEDQIIAYKKKALEIAIAEAKGDIIVTTDADCIVPESWLFQIHNAYQNTQNQFVAAPVNFTPAGSKDLLYYLQSIDFMTMQGITAAVNALKLGNMSNGANLSFRKSAYEAVGGYKDLQHLASGDDMMLMNKIEQKFPNGIAYLKASNSIVKTPCQPTWKSFLNQRIRWASKNGKYNDSKLNISLLIVYLFNCNLFCLTLCSFWKLEYFQALIISLIFKTLIELYFLFPISNFYNKTKELLWFACLQPIHIMYIISAGFLGFGGKYEWKGRLVK